MKYLCLVLPSRIQRAGEITEIAEVSVWLEGNDERLLLTLWGHRTQVTPKEARQPGHYLTKQHTGHIISRLLSE